jgi:RNA polymerase sigma-70 factor, ECF subfamily
MAQVVAEQQDLRDLVAFGALYDEALPLIYSYFLRRCGGVAPLAEDLTQETFLAAVHQVKRGATVDAPVPWLFGIARHTLIDHYRVSLNGIERSKPWNDETDAIPDERDDFGAAIERDQAILALNALPPAQRLVIALRYLDGLRVAEIASQTGKSVHAVESLLARGRASFKRAYLEHGHE